MTTRDRILAFIRDSKHSPTVAEIANHVGRSKSTVHVHLVWLERQGFIERFGDERRIYATPQDVVVTVEGDLSLGKQLADALRQGFGRKDAA